jgi:hypothetical protein
MYVGLEFGLDRHLADEEEGLRTWGVMEDGEETRQRDGSTVKTMNVITEKMWERNIQVLS